MSAEPILEKAAADLEWGVLVGHLASRCLGAEAAARMRALVPAVSLELARESAELLCQALEAAGDDAPVPQRALPELGRILPRIEKGSVASGEELRDVLLLLEASSELRGYAAGQRERRPVLAGALGSDAALDDLREDLDAAIERDGSVADSASPELRDARRRVGEVRRELGSRLGQLMRRYDDVLRDQFWTERDGRFVLPVRSDAHLRVPGIVLGSSASGATLYVEPEEVTALGNRLKVAEAEVEREVARVLAVLSERVRGHSPALAGALKAAIRADSLAALTRFAKDTRSVALVPDAEPRAELVAMRHPLLLLQDLEVVANDITLASGTALVLSGPNAGGKTVALKCLGLAAWMARAGVPVPCEPGSSIGWFDPVLTDVGDDQSLLRSLSTFSAHVANLARILDLAGESSLVLLDEVAAGTDPEEGSALAASVLEALVQQGAAVAVTTHYERLKELGARGGAFVNGSVGFDLEAMAPTFRLTLGVPGASSALAVAARYGIPADVVARAQALMPERAQDREELVKKLEAERSALEHARAAAEEELARQRQLRAEAEAERKKVRDQERAHLVEEARELTTAVREARSRLREARKRLDRADASRGELRELEREVNDAARQIALGSALETATRAPATSAGRRAPRPDELTPGTRVFLPTLGARGEIVEGPVKGQVRVLAGSLKLVVAVGDLLLDTGGKPRTAAPAPKKPEPAPKLALHDGFVPVRTSGNTLDLRGQRVEEALDAVDAFVDRMLRVGEAAAYVLHGHGTGALKLAVRAHLSASGHVARAKPAEPDDGGDAFTLFWLRG